MLNILDDYLSGAASHELKESIRQAFELFDRYGMDDYESGFEEFVMLGDSVDTGTTVSSVIELTRTLQFQVCAAHGVTISEDATITTLNVFLKGLLLIPDYDNAAALLGLLEMTGDTREIVAECIALVTGDSPDHLLTQMEHADPQLLQLMTEKLDQGTYIDTDETAVLKRERVERYKAFIHMSGIAQLKIAHLLEHGVDVGHPLMVYLNLIGPDFASMEPVLIANEFIAMCIVSSDHADNPRGAFKDNIEQFLSNIDVITKSNLAMGDLLLKLAQHKEI